MDAKTMVRAGLSILALLIILLGVSAWTGFPFGGVRDWIAGWKVKQVVAEQTAQSSLTSQEELNNLLKSTNTVQRKKERAQTGLSQAAKPRPTDDPEGKDAARRRYDAWRAGIAGVCPDCATGELENPTP